MAPAPGTSAPFAPVRWQIVAGRTALVCIDLQNDVLHEEGRYARSGVDVSHNRRVIEPTHELVREARRRGIPVIWTRHGFRNDADAGILLPLRPFLRDGGFRPGTWGHELLAELDVADGDWVIDKNRFSGFYATNLELVLRGLGADTLLVAGVLTNQCVSATTRDAFQRDFKPIVVEECTGTTLPHLHGPALEMIRVGYGEVRSLAETLAELRSLPLVAAEAVAAAPAGAAR